MISFLQVKQPAISTSSHQASSESLQSFLVHMAPSAMQNGFDFSQISGKYARHMHRKHHAQVGVAKSEPSLTIPSNDSIESKLLVKSN